ncbi:DUF3570 domain-containing protein [bacterium]|nr:DUF3570 domain-containing protein [bacterium]
MAFVMAKQIFAEQYIAFKSLNFKDSKKIDIWEGLVLYKTDLSTHTQMTVQYGLDSVTSASFGVVSGVSGASASASAIRISDDEEDDDEDSEYTASERSTKTRQQAGLSITHAFAPDVKGTSSVRMSYKTDYQSYIAGQTITFPIAGPNTILGVGGYYTQNNNNPLVTTTNVQLEPPSDTDSTRVTVIGSLEHVLSRKSKLKFLAEGFEDKGYLSTGYQRVTITSDDSEALEVLPSTRTGLALSMIYSQWLFDSAALHLRGRVYQDSYDINAYSLDAQIMKYLAEDLVGDVRLRYYTQSSASFFGESFVNMPDGFFTNHPALSQFNAYQATAGIKKEVEWFGGDGAISAVVSFYYADLDYNFGTLMLGYETTF